MASSFARLYLLGKQKTKVRLSCRVCTSKPTFRRPGAGRPNLYRIASADQTLYQPGA